MKLMVTGHAGHGKDSVCEIIARDYGLKFESSSKFAALRAVEPYLLARGIGYSNYEAMYADRINHRAEWHDAIVGYNTPDLARLGRELYQVADIYCGIRNPDEFNALKREGLIDFTIWVDAGARLPPEPTSSNQMTAKMANWVLDNNGPRSQLDSHVKLAMRAAEDFVKFRAKYPETI